VGKGDPRTKRGKIFKGSFGKKRPNPRKARQQAEAAAKASS
jgi:ribosomal small subunit protein bTHX